MIPPEFLQMLRCPEDRSPLAEVDSAMLDRINAAMTAGTLRNRGGELVSRKLEGGLVRADGTYVYPIFDGIPILLIDEGVALSQTGAAPNARS